MNPNQMSGSAFIKEKNKRCILQYVKEQGPVSRAELAERLFLSKPTVSALVDELLQENWLKESGIGQSSIQGGRKPIQLIFNSHAVYVIGVDIGGTKVRTAISDLAGHILAVEEFHTQEHRISGVVKGIEHTVEKLLHQTGIEASDILGMGIGAPGMTDVVSGVVLDAPSLSWRDYPLKKEAESIFPWPVVIDNDVNIAVLAEQWIGAAKGMNNVVLISIGTGIGCGLIINGQLFRGSTFAAGEIGYMVTDKNKATDNSLPPPHEGYGFLDLQTGGAAISQKMQQLLSSEGGHDSTSPPITAKSVFEAAIAGDDAALKIINEVIDHLGFAIANVISIINPEIVLLGGGISKSADWYIPRIQKIILDHAAVSAPVKTTVLGENLGVVGAISLVLRESESLLKVM